MKGLNERLTRIVERILKIIRWENNEFNQQTISVILGWIVGWSLIILYEVIFA